MAKENSTTKWLETGYMLFACEGPDGIQIERIARILGLNKSSFYHYFGTLEVFYEMMIQYHYAMTDIALKEAQEAETLDPAYLDIIVKHKIPFMFQMQLNRHKKIALFAKACSKVNQKIDQSLILLWKKHLNHTNEDLSLLCLSFIRDTFYARISFENFNYHLLHELACGAKRIVEKIQEGKICINKFEAVRSY
jgi:AcrR family transcriptional regulator